MANRKVIAITAILVIVIAAGLALLVMNKDDGTDRYDVDETGRLMILGNADNNDVLDRNDIDTLKDIISSGEWDRERYPYADADNSGSIDQADVDMVERILDKSVGRVNYVDIDGIVKSSNFPIDRYVSIGTFAINTMIVLGEDKCVGISGSKTFKDEVYWAGIQDLPKVSNSAKKADYELVTQIDGVQAIFFSGNISDGITNEDDFVKAGIDVVRLDFNGPNEVAALMIMGFLIDEVERSLDILEYYDAVTQKAEEVVSKHPELAGRTALTFYNNLYVFSNAGDQGYIPYKIGLVNAWEYDPARDEQSSMSAKTGDSEWYLNQRFRSDYIIGQVNLNYDKDASAESVMSQMNEYFIKLDAYPDNSVIINSSVPLFAKMAYLLEGLFPEDVGVGYGNSIFQAYLEEFNPAFTATGYDVSKDGLFLVTPEEIRAYADAHKS